MGLRRLDEHDRLPGKVLTAVAWIALVAVVLGGVVMIGLWAGRLVHEDGTGGLAALTTMVTWMVVGGLALYALGQE